MEIQTPTEEANLGEWAVRYNVQEACGIDRAKTVEPIELPFVMVSGVESRNRVLDECAHGRTWQVPCAQRL